MRYMIFFERSIKFLSRLCDGIAQAGVFAMLLLIVINIILREFGKPVFGTYDYVSFIGAIVVAFALANCAIEKGHTQVELLIDRLSAGAQGIVDSVTGILSLTIFAVITWQCVVLGNDMQRTGEVSMTSHAPFYPYIYAIAFGCGLTCLVILRDLLRSVVKAVKG